MEKWIGKVAVVTGASSGIGKEIALRLAHNGLNVIGIANEKKILEISEEFKEKTGRLYPYMCDVTKEEEVLEAFKWIAENVGTVQILINNAGIARQTTLINGCTSMWQDVISTNLMGVCICTREAIRAMRGSNNEPEGPEAPGHIIYINSVLGHRVSPLVHYVNVYAASKFGVTAVAETLTNELNKLKSKIKVTSISLGLVRTSLHSTFNLESLKTMENMPHLNPEDVADAVINVLGTKPHVAVKEVTIQPLGEKF